MSEHSSPADNPLGVYTERVNGAQIVRFQFAKIMGDGSVKEMGDRLLDCIERAGDPPCLVLNLDGVTFLSSAALGKLILISRKLKERGGSLRLCSLSPAALDVFRVAHLQDYFQIYPDQTQAMS